MLITLIVISVILIIIGISYLSFKLKRDRLSKWKVGYELTFEYTNSKEYQHASNHPLPNTRWNGVTVGLVRWDMSKIEVKYGDGTIREYSHDFFRKNLDYENRLKDKSYNEFMSDLDKSENEKKLENRISVIEKILKNK